MKSYFTKFIYMSIDVGSVTVEGAVSGHWVSQDTSYILRADR